MTSSDRIYGLGLPRLIAAGTPLQQQQHAEHACSSSSGPARPQPYERSGAQTHPRVCRQAAPLTFILADAPTAGQLSSEADTEFTVGLILWLERVNDPSAGSPTEQLTQLR